MISIPSNDWWVVVVCGDSCNDTHTYLYQLRIVLIPSVSLVNQRYIWTFRCANFSITLGFSQDEYSMEAKSDISLAPLSAASFSKSLPSGSTISNTVTTTMATTVERHTVGQPSYMHVSIKLQQSCTFRPATNFHKGSTFVWDVLLVL